MEATYTLHICGCRGSHPMEGGEFVEFGGQTSCYVIKTDRYALVIDCGTGLHDAGPLLADCAAVDVVLTHVHYDHILGLVDWGVFPRGARPRFWGTFSRWLGEKTLSDFFRPPFWPVQPQLGPLCELSEDGGVYELGGGIGLEIAPSCHPNDASLLLLRLGRKRVCFASDCESAETVPDRFVRDCDLLLYDGMFEDENYANHEGWGHSTWQEGCRLAGRAGVKKLIIIHHAPRSTDEELRRLERKGQALFAGCRFARAGDRIVI